MTDAPACCASRYDSGRAMMHRCNRTQTLVNEKDVCGFVPFPSLSRYPILNRSQHPSFLASIDNKETRGDKVVSETS